MVMRVTQQSLYGSVISQNNAALAKLMATNNQASTQKRINAPSDDPNGAVQVLNTRTDLSQLSQYKSNITTAQGWLSQADSTLSSVSTLVTTIKGYAEQAATGTVTDENRGEIASAVRQYFGQLISLANTSYNGQSIFAGQKTDTEAYSMGLAMTSNDATFDTALTQFPAPGYTVSGSSDSTVLVQFTDTTASPPAFEYTSDGGTTWQTGSYASPAPSADTQTLQMGGVTVTMSNTALAAVTQSANHDDADGTWLWIRPSANYQGNNNDDVTVTSAGSAVTATAQGVFPGNVQVRLDDTSGDPYVYSYSTDGGTSWVTGNTSGAVGAATTSLSVPGGILTLDMTSGTPANGDQFFIQPSTADISVAISPTDAVTVNGVGKDIFGGMYETTVTDTATGDKVKVNTAATFDGSDAGNLLETVGKLVGYLETNNQGGIQECLDNLTTSQNQVLVAAASVGAKENRVSSTENMVTTLSENATTTLSNVEDADLTSLITKLSEQELAYQAVLKSSSMVMNLSLVSYI
jgi:flagellar hook-associated protein 3 FlgL